MNTFVVNRDNGNVEVLPASEVNESDEVMTYISSSGIGDDCAIRNRNVIGNLPLSLAVLARNVVVEGKTFTTFQHPSFPGFKDRYVLIHETRAAKDPTGKYNRFSRENRNSVTRATLREFGLPLVDMEIVSQNVAAGIGGLIGSEYPLPEARWCDEVLKSIFNVMR
jgi:hypothetical protein